MTSARPRRALVVVLVALALAAAGLLAAPLAHAQQEGTAGFEPPIVTVPSQLPGTPSDFSVDASTAINTSNEDSRVEALREERGDLSAIPNISRGRWEILYIDEDEAIALVFVDGNGEGVEEFWTGPQVEWPMARGYEEQFGHVLNAPYVWIPLALLFFLGLVDLRRPRRLVHLDLLVLLSFGISHVFFNTADIGVSVPLAYPPLLYLLGRMIWIGFKGPGEGLRPSAPIALLAVATVLLIGGRVAVNIIDSGVIDVGFAGVIGAERITHGDPLYGEGAFGDLNERGDTYGPANYFAYVPFEQAFPWEGAWDDLPSAHAAAIFFDLACVAGLFFLGGRLRPGVAGRQLGIVLAFAWVSYPYTTLVLQSNANDSLIGALLIWGLVLFSSFGLRALMIALAAAAKFTPIVLVPLFATGRRGLIRWTGSRPAEGGALRLGPLSLPRRTALRIAEFGTVFFAALAFLYVYPAIEPGLATTWDRTIATQVGRESPFSIWGQVTALQPLQTLLTVAVVAFAASLALVPRRRSLTQIAALSAALMIAVQLTLEHWFYLYLPWFFGLLMAAIALPPGQGESTRTASPLRRDTKAEARAVHERAAPGAGETAHPGLPAPPRRWPRPSGD